MIPLSLRLSGFLSYWDPVELDFSSFDLACISGANGAGKSTLLDAITWALFGQARRRDDTIINSHSTQAEVIFDFLYEGNRFRVQRIKPANKSTLLEFYIQSPSGDWRALTEHSLRETELRIEQTLRLDFDTFTNASFFLQGKADQFAQQRPGDRKRILSTILGLEIWETYQKSAAERRKALETELIRTDSVLQEIQAELNQEDERRKRLKSLEENLAQAAALRLAQENALDQLRRLASSLDEQRRLVEMLSGQLSASRLRHEELYTRLVERQSEQRAFRQEIARAAEVEAAYQLWQKARVELEQWEQVAANFRQVETRRNTPLREIETERARLETELAALQVQRRQIEDQRAALPILQSELQIAHQAVTELQSRLDQRPLFETEQQRLMEVQTSSLAENKQMKLEMEDLKKRIDRLAEAIGAVCPLCGQPLSPEERQELVLELEAEGRELGNRYRANQEQVRLGEEQRKEIGARLGELALLDNDLRLRQRTLDQLDHQQAQTQQTIDGWQAGAAQRLAKLQNILLEDRYAQPARAALAEIDAELQKLGYDIGSHETARKAEVNGRSSEDQRRGIENARAALAPLEREIKGLEKQIKDDLKQLTALESSYQQSAEKYTQDSARMPDLGQAEAELYNLQEQENRLRMQVGGATQAVEVLKTLRSRQKQHTHQRDDLAVRISRFKVLEKAFSKDGVPALLIEQALPEIESQANEVLDRLSDGGMSVRFETQKEYKDKNREDKKETLDILISDAAGTREYELFSGGEAFRVNFAIRLALSRVLAHRAGARLQTLVIDEGFGSQDSEGRQRLIEAINMVRSDFAKVLVITHLEELKDAFPARIEVEKTPHGSRLTVLA